MNLFSFGLTVLAGGLFLYSLATTYALACEWCSRRWGDSRFPHLRQAYTEVLASATEFVLNPAGFLAAAVLGFPVLWVLGIL